MNGIRCEALFTDLYELAMARVYAAEGITRRAVFETFFRSLPERRNYVVAAGLSELLEELECFRFRADDLAHLAQLGFPPELLYMLAELRFSGDVWAMPEGTTVFPNEPMLQVVAPLIEAQLLETLVLNRIHVHSVLASKAVRVITAAAGRPVIEFGARRAHGTDAALALARASWIAGAAGTSNVLAGRRYGIPVFGTMAHSFVQVFPGELEAFAAFARHNPQTTLLVDTYDTLAGIDKAIQLAQSGRGVDVRSVRLDSGDLGALARAARAKLDAAGLTDVKIFGSSGLDEYRIAALVRSGAPIDGFGVGSHLAVSHDAPGLDLAYKLVEYDGRPSAKFSSGKAVYPGRKQVFRRQRDQRHERDLIARFDEQHEGRPLLELVMKDGRRLQASNLERIRQRVQSEREALPPALLALEPSAPYTVEVSTALERDLTSLGAELRR